MWNSVYLRSLVKTEGELCYVSVALLDCHYLNLHLDHGKLRLVFFLVDIASVAMVIVY